MSQIDTALVSIPTNRFANSESGGTTDLKQRWLSMWEREAWTQLSDQRVIPSAEINDLAASHQLQLDPPTSASAAERPALVTIEQALLSPSVLCAQADNVKESAGYQPYAGDEPSRSSSAIQQAVGDAPNVRSRIRRYSLEDVATRKRLPASDGDNEYSSLNFYLSGHGDEVTVWIRDYKGRSLEPLREHFGTLETQLRRMGLRVSRVMLNGHAVDLQLTKRTI